MIKLFFKKLIISILVFSILCTSFTFSSIVSDSDGAAFVTKAEFMNLQNEFTTQLETYNTSLGDKIDGAIANYLESLRVTYTKVTPYMNKLNADRRTFTQAIANPTTSGQSNIYISTNGYWVNTHPSTGTYGESADAWSYYAHAGLNNHNGSHEKNLVEKNNGQSGKYMFLDKETVNNKEISYIYDGYRKYLQYKIISCGGQTMDTYGGSSPTYGGPSSITWSATYNWAGTSTRKCGNNGSSALNVTAIEAIILLISNDDYDSSKSGIQEVPWVNKTSGSTIFTTNMGSLYKKDQYEWNYTKSNFSVGNTAQQANSSRKSGDGNGNSYNSGGNTIPLTFRLPTISTPKGSDIAVKDISSLVGKPVYYYSGLPLFELPKSVLGARIKFKTKINAPDTSTKSGVLLAIKNNQFKNTAIGSESDNDILYKKEWTSTTLPDTIDIKLDYDAVVKAAGGELWVKAIATNTNCTVTLIPDEMYYY